MIDVVCPNCGSEEGTYAREFRYDPYGEEEYATECTKCNTIYYASDAAEKENSSALDVFEKRLTQIIETGNQPMYQKYDSMRHKQDMTRTILEEYRRIKPQLARQMVWDNMVNICPECGFDKTLIREPIFLTNNPLSLAAFFDEEERGGRCKTCKHWKSGFTIVGNNPVGRLNAEWKGKLSKMHDKFREKMKASVGNPRIRKVRMLAGKSLAKAYELKLNDEDLVILRDDQSIEKIDGDPLEQLLNIEKINKQNLQEISIHCSKHPDTPQIACPECYNEMQKEIDAVFKQNNRTFSNYDLKKAAAWMRVHVGSYWTGRRNREGGKIYDSIYSCSNEAMKTDENQAFFLLSAGMGFKPEEQVKIEYIDNLIKWIESNMGDEFHQMALCPRSLIKTLRFSKNELENKMQKYKGLQ